MATTESGIRLRLRDARESLADAGILDGAKNTKLTVQVQDRLLAAARERTGIERAADLILAGLTLLAAPEQSPAWLVHRHGNLPLDFDPDF